MTALLNSHGPYNKCSAMTTGTGMLCPETPPTAARPVTSTQEGFHAVTATYDAQQKAIVALTALISNIESAYYAQRCDRWNVASLEVLAAGMSHFREHPALSMSTKTVVANDNRTVLLPINLIYVCLFSPIAMFYSSTISLNLATAIFPDFGALQTDRQTDRQTQTDRQADRQTDRQAGRQTGRQTDRQAGRQADRQTDRQTDRDREAGRQTDRKADKRLL